MRILYINPVNGIAGDMLTAALLDLGADQKEFLKSLESIPLPSDEWSVEIVPTMRRGISGTYFRVGANDTSGGHGRHLSPILEMIDESLMSDRAKKLAKTAFTKLAEAEAEVHNTTPEKIHFHEVGAIDSIIDICGASIALDLLNVDRVVATAPALGGGTVKCDHGTLAVPVPAVCKLLKGLPTKLGPIDTELTTPTGAALLTAFADSFDERPEGTLVATGYGAGTKDFESHANVVQALLLDSDTSDSHTTLDTRHHGRHSLGDGGSTLVIEATIDDMPGEYMSHIGPLLLEEGALDYAIIPCTMKKGRPGMILQVLCSPEKEKAVTAILLRETTTFGVRKHICERTILDREHTKIETEFGPISVKIGRDPETGDVLQISPEYEDCHAVALKHNVPLKVVYAAATAAAKKSQASD